MQSDTTNFFYYLNENNKAGRQKELSNEQLNQALKVVSKQVLREKTSSLQDLDRILDVALNKTPSEKQTESESQQEMVILADNEPITKYLQRLGYLKDEKKWLTNKAFFELGQKMLNDVTKAIESGDLGFHETRNNGFGENIFDTTKKLEIGENLQNLNIPLTVLNAVQRKKIKGESIEFPLKLEFDDFEKFETREEIKIAVVYCIDLSSTMKYSLNSGEGSRIESAKKALWALYVLNKKFYANDSIYIVGFGSLASQVKPSDIPYLKTYDANDNFLHYTNYQAALRLALKILKKDGSQNKRIVLVTDGQPSACFVDDETQKNAILLDKPYSHFYKPDQITLSKMQNERDIKLEIADEMVYLCYRYKQIDPVIESKTLQEARKCRKEGIEIDTIMVSEEEELLTYVENLEKQLQGRAYYINPEKIDRVLVSDFIFNRKRIITSKRAIRIE